MTEEFTSLVQPVCSVFHPFFTEMTLAPSGSPSKRSILHCHSNAALACTWQWEGIHTMVYWEPPETSFLKAIAGKNGETNTIVHT